ncbi:hypothetical protein GCM10010449_08030 [Streptomyces rectiviolaceus]|uniref:Integral membrane protein n=2 Tax=Streptomyces rectiviolaceus TaxID=332591 RepID=A0ABP6M7Q6_9ACTN
MVDMVSNAAEVTNKAVFFTAGTDENVQGVAVEVAAEVCCVLSGSGGSGSPPRRRCGTEARDTERMKLSRPVSWFLLAFGVWSWFIWITFVKNLWKDGSGLAFDDAGDPTAYFWVHLTLAVVSFVLGTVVGTIGLRGVRALRRTS